MSQCFRCGQPWESHTRVGGSNDRHHRICADGKRANTWRRAASNSFTDAEIEVAQALVKAALLSQAAPLSVIRSKGFSSFAAKLKSMKDRINDPLATLPCSECGEPYRTTANARAKQPACDRCSKPSAQVAP